MEKAAGRIVIMPGSGVNAQNIAKIAKETGAKEFHLSAREQIESKMVYRNPPDVKMGGKTIVINEYAQEITGAGIVKNTLLELKKKY